MGKHNFYSTKVLEDNITNRKMSDAKNRVEWLKIQLRFHRKYPDTIQYKYSNQEDHYFEKVDISKRKKKVLTQNALPLLYPNGNVINEAKKKYLLQLMELIPPLHHKFYENLKSSTQSSGGDLIGSLEEDD